MKKIILTLLALALPVAALATGSGLDLDPTPGDYSVSYLSDIFGVVDGVLHGSSQLLGNMFGVFNAAVLALGTILAAYVLLVSTMNTAHQGEVMGQKWSSIWIPVRMTGGIALLLPKASGYCAIQIFVMWVIVQGVGAADSIWSTALGYLARGGAIVQQPLKPEDGGLAVRPAAGSMIKSLVCLNALEKITDDWQRQQSQLNPGGKVPGPVPSFVQSSSDVLSVKGNSAGKYVLPFPNFSGTSDYRALNGVCGKVSWTQKVTSTRGIGAASVAQSEKLNQSMAIGIQQMINDLSGPAQDIYNNSTKDSPLPLGTYKNLGPSDKAKDVIPSWNGSGGKPPLMQGSELVNAATDYTSLVLPLLNQAVVAAGEAGNTKFMADANKGGWILAGQYYFNLTQMNNKMGADIGSSKPTAKPPQRLTSEGLGGKGPYGYSDVTTAGQRTQLDDLNTQTGAYVKQANDYPFPYASTRHKDDSTTYASTATFDPGSWIGVVAGALAIGAASPAAGLGMVAVMVGTQVMTNAVLGGLVKIGRQSANTNPIADLATFGMGLLTAAGIMWLVAGAIYAGVTGFVSVGACLNPMPYAMLSFAMWFLPMWTLLIGIMFTTGAFLQFYVPLIPYIIFTFGAIGWLIGAIEAMIAAPLIGLAVATPEGHEAMGKSVNGFMILIGVFLRPSLMLFGFFTGIILSYVSVWLINQGFIYTIVSAFSTPGTSKIDLTSMGIGAIFFPAILVCIYTPLIVLAINKSFSLIHKVPDDILKYIGGQGESLGAEVSGGAQELQKGTEQGMKGMGSAATSKMAEAGSKMDSRHERGQQGKADKAAADKLKLESDKGGNKPGAAGGTPAGGGGQTGATGPKTKP